MPQKTVLGLLTAAERQLFTFCFKPQFSVVCLGLLERKIISMFLMFRLFSKQVVHVSSGKFADAMALPEAVT